MNILEEANKIIYSARNVEYGHPLDNHGTTAAFWNVYLDAIARRGKLKLGPVDVCLFNILQKISREATTGAGKRDTLVDIAGYAGNVEMILKEIERRAGA